MAECYFLGGLVPQFLQLADGEEVTQVRDFQMNVFTLRNDVQYQDTNVYYSLRYLFV